MTPTKTEEATGVCFKCSCACDCCNDRCRGRLVPVEALRAQEKKLEMMRDRINLMITYSNLTSLLPVWAVWRLIEICEESFK